MKAADLCHRLGPSNGRQHPSVSIDKWRASARSRTLLDQLGDTAACCIATGASPGNAFPSCPRQ